MQTSERLCLEQIQAFLEGSGEVGFKGQNREGVYGWVNQTLRQGETISTAFVESTINQVVSRRFVKK